MHSLLFPPWPRELDSPLDGNDIIRFDSTFEVTRIPPPAEADDRKSLMRKDSCYSDNNNHVELSPNGIVTSILTVSSFFSASAFPTPPPPPPFTDESVSSSSSIASSYENESISDFEDETSFGCGSAKGCSNSNMVGEDGVVGEKEANGRSSSSGYALGDVTLESHHINNLVLSGESVCVTSVEESGGDGSNRPSPCSETVDSLMTVMPMTGITSLQQLTQGEKEQAHKYHTTEERDQADLTGSGDERLTPHPVQALDKADHAESSSGKVSVQSSSSSLTRREAGEHVLAASTLLQINPDAADHVSENISESTYQPDCSPANNQNVVECKATTNHCYLTTLGHREIPTTPTKKGSKIEKPEQTTESPQSKPTRSVLNLKTRHICSTCHLYAPSSLANFYLHAWLNQQCDFYPSTAHSESLIAEATRPRKQVKWPSDNLELVKTIVIDRWIERGVHVYPHPAYTRNYDVDDDQDEESESDSEDEMFPEIKSGINQYLSGKSERHAEKRPKHPVAVVRKQEEVRKSALQQTPLRGQMQTQMAGSVCGDVDFSRDRDWDTHSALDYSGFPTEDDKQSLNDMQHDNNNKSSNPSLLSRPPSSRSSSSSSLSSLSLSSAAVSSSASTPPSEAPSLSPPSSPLKKPTNLCTAQFSKPSPASSPKFSPTKKQVGRYQQQLPQIPQNIPPLQLGKKNYSSNAPSGIKATVIRGSSSTFSSEHEAAVKIRGQDPIKNRAMIENYWQF